MPDWRGFQPRSWSAAAPAARQLHALIQHIDACMEVDRRLPTQLALDDVLHRQGAVLLAPSLLEETPTDGERLRTRQGKSAFDDRLDCIRANLDEPPRLSDLEARSHDSRRPLQDAFRQKLSASPKQWIRQERLALAMERLRQEDPPPSVQAVALACGYRNLSLFSGDFKRRFGISPFRVQRDPR